MSRRVRTHANPLRRFEDLRPPDWDAIFAAPDRPFALDLGSSGGEFLLGHARERPDWNILGVEVRRPLVERLLVAIRDAALLNAHVLHGNIGGRLAEFTPRGVLHAVYVLFPDPWFKKKHHKRRLLTPAFLGEAADLMPPRGRIVALSDQPVLVDWMRRNLEADARFQAAPPGPRPARSGWEEHCIRTGRTYDALEYRRV